MNNPFRYFPCLEIAEAADNLIRRIDSDKYLHSLFCEGKMMGVLWVQDHLGEKSFLYAFSGNVQGLNEIEGFVPPIYNLLDKDGYFKTEEARISSIDKKAKSIKGSSKYTSLSKRLDESIKNYNTKIEEAKKQISLQKEARNIRRQKAESLNEEERSVIEQSLIRESQFEKAELHRLKKTLKAEIDQIQKEFDDINSEILSLQKEAAESSFALQEWIFHQFIVHNARGHKKSIWDIFQDKGIVPPGGTGECAGPKLLEYAYRNNLTPLAMGEFWYGKTQGEEVREHGRFYPSCQPKCGTLLPFMLEGLEIDKEMRDCNYTIMFEDDSIVVVNKPS
ncbi:MAG: RNA pseudouridine synthase, partial [Bacteroidales bacterium]|nr:RNA pseudouridine synthase [Bacteroidales bacterium]